MTTDQLPAIVPSHFGLGDLIDRLASEPDQDRRIPVGFKHPHSWRGDYWELAFEVAYDVTVGEMLAAARSALGTTYEGWKGGDYTMGQHTPVWLVVEEGTSDGETLGAILLDRLLAPQADVDAAYERGKAEQAAEVERLRSAVDHVKQLNRPMVTALRKCAADTSSNWDGATTVFPPGARGLVALIDALLSVTATVPAGGSDAA